MRRDPLSKARSPWVEDPPAAERLRHNANLEDDLRIYRRQVHDGMLVALTGTIPGHGAHLSISHRRPNNKGHRYPTWDEIADARYELCPPDVTMAMLLPPLEEYVALHPTTFHLHEIKDPPTDA